MLTLAKIWGQRSIEKNFQIYLALSLTCSKFHTIWTFAVNLANYYGAFINKNFMWFLPSFCGCLHGKYPCRLTLCRITDTVKVLAIVCIDCNLY